MTVTDRIRWLLRQRTVRYLLVGGMLFVLDTVVFVALVKGLDVDVRLAQLVSRTVGAATGFFAHRSITFREPGKEGARSIASQGAGYVFVTFFLLGVSPFVVQGAVWAIPFSLVLAKIAAEAILVVMAYLMLNYVFAQRPVDEVEPD